jgi:hypothetical protein
MRARCSRHRSARPCDECETDRVEKLVNDLLRAVMLMVFLGAVGLMIARGLP